MRHRLVFTLTKAQRIVLLAVLAAIAVVLFLASRHDVPAGQPPLAELNAESMTAFQEEFNRRAGDVRIVLLLSPT